MPPNVWSCGSFEMRYLQLLQHFIEIVFFRTQEA
ncbi:hypothetical protein D915_000398 [Fasciola hepatica]|uniref:Uncharacterized protein n=1 Tax=Fasciola hepatica TaxID=6192 RepID=A0A4E0S0B3_FASHE|nr:hypothetical protein D915_000398 [Fasciola hepatica]